MANIGPKGILRHIDDPSITVIGTSETTGKTWVGEGDSGTSFLKAVAAGKGLHYTAATAAVNDENEEFVSNGLYFAGQEGHAAVEILVQFDAVTNVAFFFGFNDDLLEASSTIPVELSGTDFTNRADTHIGFVYDTDATNDELYCDWANAAAVTSTAIADLRMLGMAPTAAKWLYMKVEMQDRGSGNPVRATFLAVDHKGRSAEKTFDTNVARSTSLGYYFAYENRAANIRNCYLRCNNWEQTIPDM